MKHIWQSYFAKIKYLHNKHNEPELFEFEIIYQMHLYSLNDIFMETLSAGTTSAQNVQGCLPSDTKFEEKTIVNQSKVCFFLITPRMP